MFLGLSPLSLYAGEAASGPLLTLARGLWLEGLRLLQA